MKLVKTIKDKEEFVVTESKSRTLTVHFINGTAVSAIVWNIDGTHRLIKNIKRILV